MTISFESRWGTRRVKTLTTKIGSGKTPSGGSESYLASGVTFLRSQNIHFDGLRLDDVVYISEATHREMRGTKVKPGDVLLNITGASLGRVSRAPEGLGEANVNQHVCIIRPNAEAHARYLAYALSSQPIQEQISELQVGGNREGLNFEQVGNLTVPAALAEEQRRIADFLDAETARIDQLALKRRQMRSLLTLKRERVIESTLGLERAQMTGGLVPLKYLAADVTVGIVITPAKWYVEADGIPALRGLNVKPNFISTGDLVQISAEGHAENRKSRLNSGDVVVVRTGQAGAAAVVPAELDGANCIDLIVVRPGRKLSPRYLQYVLNSGYASARVTEHSVGSIQAHFNVGAMKQIPIPSIPRTEQDEIVRLLDIRVGALDLLHRKLDHQEQLLTERRQALITAAVTGQFDVTTASGRNVTDGVSA
ncbi:restriction endonuclease subunit S [Streptomyces sp. NPDC005322]|uniref:restriction endonuclease subunit S n=1 Tax=Streptomyces sp. NPDC005322 TaxID=3157032 RepID=UPI0033A7CEE2